jgi:Fe-S oxidoreductase
MPVRINPKRMDERAEMRKKVERMTEEEYSDFLRRSDLKTLKNLINCGIGGKRYWMAMHELSGRMLRKYRDEIEEIKPETLLILERFMRRD